MTGFEWVKLFLDFATGIAWPIIVVIVMLAFRERVGQLLDKLKSFTFTQGETTAKAEFEREKVELPDFDFKVDENEEGAT